MPESRVDGDRRAGFSIVVSTGAGLLATWRTRR